MKFAEFFSFGKENSTGPNKYELDCPKCKQRMIRMTRQDITIDKCMKCGGTWLDKGEMFMILRKLDNAKSKNELR